jgi:seryl-tRNA synthetase
MLQSGPAPLPPVAATFEGERAVLVPTGAAGVYLQSDGFQRVAAALEEGFRALLGRAPDLTLRASPILPMRDLERSAYIDRFPQLVATVTPHLHTHDADDQSAMTPAACLSLYRLVAARGPIEGCGLTVAVTAPCHRTEASYEPTRLRAFTMSELVFFGRPAQASAFVEGLRAAAAPWLRSLGLAPIERAANDPFYGRGSDVLASHQRSLQTKVEIVLPVGALSEVACFSFNLHAEFFSRRWEIALEEGGWAQSACVGVGLERLTLALIERHGDCPSLWPAEVRRIIFGPAG